MRSEALYQASLIKKLQKMFPTAFLLKNDPSATQGIPDLMLIFGDRWAMLEVKLSAAAAVQPNQAYYVNLFNEMSFASFIYPENEEQVLNALQSTFGTPRQACHSES